MKERLDKKYFDKSMRRCGVCGKALPQREMIRDDCSDTGWVCPDCDSDLHIEYDYEDF